jgi:hypothetical protein
MGRVNARVGSVFQGAGIALRIRLSAADKCMLQINALRRANAAVSLEGFALVLQAKKCL